MRVRKLHEFIQMKGLNYRLIDRTKNKAIYSRHRPEDDSIHSYEVFVIQTIKSRPFSIGSNSDLYDAVEKFPDKKVFGKKAWLFVDPIKAKQKYDSL